MKKILILLILGLFSIQLRAMDEEGRSSKKQKTATSSSCSIINQTETANNENASESDDNELESKEEFDYLSNLDQELIEWEKFHNDYCIKYQTKDGYYNTENEFFKSYIKDNNIRLRKPELQLKFAALKNYIKLAKNALDLGANPNITINSEDDKIVSAKCTSHDCRDLLTFTIWTKEEIFYLLLNDPKILVNPEVTNSTDDCTPLSQAAFSLKPHIMISLIQAGANSINDIDDNGNNLLMQLLESELCPEYSEDEFSSYAKFIKCLKILVNNGADINKQNFSGQTGLMHAIGMYNPCLIEFIVNELNAKTNIKDIDGKTAVDLAKGHLRGSSEDYDSSEDYGDEKEYKKITKFLEAVNKKNIAFVKKLIKNEILENTPLAKVLVEVTMQYLEDSDINSTYLT